MNSVPHRRDIMPGPGPSGRAPELRRRPRYLLPVRVELDDLAAPERILLVSDAAVASWPTHEKAGRLATGEVLHHVVAPAPVGGLGGAPLAGGQDVIAQTAVDDVRPLATVDPVGAAPPVDGLRAVHASDPVALCRARHDGRVAGLGHRTGEEHGQDRRAQDPRGDGFSSHAFRPPPVVPMGVGLWRSRRMRATYSRLRAKVPCGRWATLRMHATNG